jgi:hypothetical protein
MRVNSIAAVIFLLAASVTSWSQPRAEVTEWKKSFGKVEQGDPVKFDYEVRNTGDQPLVFERYDVECSCTAAQLPKVPLLPGKATTITVTFNTSSAIGRQDRVVKVYCNDPKKLIRLRFKGDVDSKR